MNKYITQLTNEQQETVKELLTSSLIEQGLQGQDLLDAIEDGMTSRLIDLQDTININKVI